MTENSLKRNKFFNDDITFAEKKICKIFQKIIITP